MRHILQEIFERYLNLEQASFDTSPRELWPTKQYAQPPQAPAGSGSGAGRGREPPRDRDN
jgi:hypothetical protein